MESETWGLRSGIWESEVEVWNLGFGMQDVKDLASGVWGLG